MLLKRSTDRFAAELQTRGLGQLVRRAPRTLQVNMGKLCNQACRHCHVDAGPKRTEIMDGRTVDRILQVLASSPGIETLDVTGGAPELNPHFRTLVDGARDADRTVMVRCNLTVFFQPGQDDLPGFYAARRAHVVASLPCYTAENVDRQRGGGVFDHSVRALRMLNDVGYGAAEGADGHADALRLDLVYNPLGPSLPPPQERLQADYRARLAADFGIRFDRLYALANMPIHRFAEDLERQERLEEYEDLLASSFNPASLDGLMCRDLLSVDWDGRLSDCDFNQMLEMPLGEGPRSIFEVDDLADFGGRRIATGSHCLGCSAGQGSSCGGAIADPGDA